MLDFDLWQALFMAGGTLLVYWGFRGHIIPRNHYRRAVEERDHWRQAAEVSTKTLEELADTSRAGVVIPRGMDVRQVRANGATYPEIRKDWTKDKPGDYSPLPPETPEQLMARIDRRNLKDWTDQWEKLTGEPWPDEDLESRRHAAAKESEARVANHFGSNLKRAFSRGGVIDMGSIELEISWGKDKPRRPAGGLYRDNIHPNE
jgi:hypothetical protein